MTSQTPDNSIGADQSPQEGRPPLKSETVLLLSSALENLDAMQEGVVACHVSMALDLLIGNDVEGGRREAE